jgi:hypothetical protein
VASFKDPCNGNPAHVVHPKMMRFAPEQQILLSFKVAQSISELE